MRQQIAARLLSTLGICFAIQAAAIAPSTFAADAKATEKRGKIVLYQRRGFLGGETLGSPRLCILNLDDGGLRIIPHPPARILGDPDWR